MSIDAVFSRAAFPALRSATPPADDAKARAAGHAAGYAAGLRAAAADVAAQAEHNAAEHHAAMTEGQAKVDSAVAVLASAALALNERVAPQAADAQDALVATAIELAEAIIGRELSDTATSAASAVHRALAGVDAATVHQVRLNPDDLAALEQQASSATGVTFVADATLQRGDAVTEFDDGFLDARIRTALDRARAAILEDDQ